MDGTAGRDGDLSAGPHPIRLFLVVRPARTVVAGTVGLGLLTAWLGMLQAPIPTAVQNGDATIPLWRMLAMGAAVLPVLALASPLGDLEVVATRRLRATQRRYLAVLGGSCAVIYLGCCSLTMDLSVVAVMARSWLGWSGLALLAGAVLGWRLAWTLPSLVAAALWFWGLQGDQGYHWWEFSARPYHDPAPLLLSAALLAAGVVAYAATPWRRRRWTAPHLRQRHTGAAPPGTSSRWSARGSARAAKRVL